MRCFEEQDMPIYEYECQECGVHFDKLQRFGDDLPDTCPNGHHRILRLLSSPAVIFKGPGFYVTDNGGNGRGKSSSSGGRPDKKADPASSAKSEETAA
jgi:putative FmdB family regulatory protein